MNLLKVIDLLYVVQYKYKNIIYQISTENSINTNCISVMWNHIMVINYKFYFFFQYFWCLSNFLYKFQSFMSGKKCQITTILVSFSHLIQRQQILKFFSFFRADKKTKILKKWKSWFRSIKRNIRFIQETKIIVFSTFDIWFYDFLFDCGAFPSE